jgi:hypothetical protein
MLSIPHGLCHRIVQRTIPRIQSMTLEAIASGLRGVDVEPPANFILSQRKHSETAQVLEEQCDS